MQALTLCDAEVVNTRTAVGQFKGQFKGGMELHAWVRFGAKTHVALPRYTANSERTSGIPYTSGAMVLEGSESKRTYIASFWYTFESISVASPLEET